MGRFKLTEDGGNKLRESIIIVGIIFLSILDIVYLRRTEKSNYGEEIVIKRIAPKDWKQALCYVAIPVSMFAVAFMLDLYYLKEFFFIAKRVLLIAVLWPIAISDYREFRIPNKWILIGILLRVILFLPEIIFARDILQATLVSEGIAVLGAIVICVACMFLSKGSIGMGDLKLMMLMGLMLGVEGICYAMFISIFFSFVIAVMLLVMRKKKKNDAIPFAPFILAGTVTAMIISGV